MKLVWLRFASSDRGSIFSYIEAKNPRAAVHVDEQIENVARAPARLSVGPTNLPTTIEAAPYHRLDGQVSIYCLYRGWLR
nr:MULTISPECIES: type II toxin-antitoxin system RelE/ParE family toxin [unclassified Bradyrhizobium]